MGARSEFENSDGSISEEARLSDLFEKVVVAYVPSNWPSMLGGTRGRVVEWIKGEDVVRYPECEGCDNRGGGVPRFGVLLTSLLLDRLDKAHVR